MSAEVINTTNTLFGLGTIAINALSVFLIIGILAADKGKAFSWFSKNTLLFIFLISLGAFLGSLFYSNVIGFLPCLLCWYQRICMYPIALISGIALFKKYEKEVFGYIFGLSFVGGLIGVWHLIEKGTGKELIPCSASGPSCLQELVKVFGYIDIPVMSLSFFVLIVLLLINRKRILRK